MALNAIDDFSAFSKTCGAGTLQLNYLEGDGSLRSRRLSDQPFLIVGRSPDADLSLADEQVRWQHCYLQVIGGQLVAVSLEESTGIAVDGVQERIGWIKPSSVLQIGSVLFRLQANPGDGSARSSSESERSASHPFSTHFARDLPATKFEIEGDSHGTYGWRLSRALTLIGQSTVCQARLVHPTISNVHAALVRTPEGIWIVDLNSREGVEVDGVFVRASRLEEGAICRLGAFTLRLCQGTLAPAPPLRRKPPLTLSSPGTRVDSPSLLATRPRVSSFNAQGTDLEAPQLLEAGLIQGAEVWPSSETEPFGPSQQAMVMLAQMLGTMHRDHMNLVKDELTEIRRLADEMHQLRVEIGQGGANQPAAEPVARPMPAASTTTPDPVEVKVTPPQAAPAEKQATLASEPPESAAEEEMPADLKRDPKECLAIASQFLAAYEQKQDGHWSRLLKAVTGLYRDQPSRTRGLRQAQ